MSESSKNNTDMQRHKMISKPHNADRFKKTKLCPQFLNGICKKGSMCNFAHGKHELKQKVNLEKTKMCMDGKNC